MTVPSPVPVEHLDAILATVWDALFADPIHPTPAPAGPTGTLTRAVVEITGAWTGTVTLTCPPALAADVTAALFALPGTHVPTEAEVADALGEVANIVAGNLKALLPEPSTLGLPAVTAAPEPQNLAPPSRTYQWHGHPLTVHLSATSHTPEGPHA